MIGPLYVIFGYQGLLGKAFYQRVSGTIPDYRMFCFDHSHVDISSRDQVREVLSFIEPTVVINCAGVSDLSLCEVAKSGAFEVNAVGPKILAEECKRIGAKLVHFSTCHVFCGDRVRPYNELQKTIPINSLGKSKLEGERAIRTTLKNHLIIRPGWLFDAESPNFIPDWVERSQKGFSIDVPDDVYGSPTYVVDVVQSTLDLLDRDAKGIFHVANSNAATWKGLAEAVCGLMRSRPIITTFSGKKLISMPREPKYSVLSCQKLNSLVGKEMRPWDVALKQCLFQMGRYRP
jgi:dTDP-4-dehydrorhamnose reductase